MHPQPVPMRGVFLSLAIHLLVFEVEADPSDQRQHPLRLHLPAQALSWSVAVINLTYVSQDHFASWMSCPSLHGYQADGLGSFSQLSGDCGLPGTCFEQCWVITAVCRSKGESSLHRRQRRKRTRSRTVLPALHSGWISNVSHGRSIRQATDILQSHRSASQLPNMANSSHLGATGAMGPATEVLPSATPVVGLQGDGGPRRWRPISTFALATGCRFVESSAFPAWSAPQQRPTRRTRRVGKEKTSPQPKAQSVPLLQALPQPPVLGQPASEASSSEAQAKLDQLPSTLTSTKEALAPSVMQILEEYSSSSSNAESKALMRAVKAKTAAKKGLAKLRASKGTFMSAWSTYLSQVSELLVKQLAEQQTALQQYDEAEVKLEEQLKEASQARLSTGKEDGLDDGMDADDHATAADAAEMNTKIAASMEAVKQTARAQAANLLHALRQAQASAAVKEERRGRPERHVATVEELRLSANGLVSSAVYSWRLWYSLQIWGFSALSSIVTPDSPTSCSQRTPISTSCSVTS